MPRSVLAVLLCLLGAVFLLAEPLPAQTISFQQRGSLLPAGAPLIGPSTQGPAQAIVSTRNATQGEVLTVSADPNGTQASLFAGRAASSMFAPWPTREREPKPRRGDTRAVWAVPTGTGPVARLRDLIASAEAGKAQYDAVQYGARIKPRKRPTQMTIGEIYAWIDATPGQPHAIGRYQIIPKTLRGLVRKAGLRLDTRYSPQVQDALADILLEEAGLSAMRSGAISRRAFMNNVAKIWAGLPNSSGKSHYHGYAGNKATMSWSHYETQMKQIFPNAG